MPSESFIALLISIAALAIVYYIAYHILEMPKRISIVITLAFAIITYLFLIENPQIIYETQTKIAMAIIAAVVGVALAIKNKVT